MPRVDLLDLVAKGIVRIAFALPAPVRNRIIYVAVMRGKAPPFR